MAEANEPTARARQGLDKGIDDACHHGVRDGGCRHIQGGRLASGKEDVHRVSTEDTFLQFGVRGS